eukprot:ctg_902.g397
MEGAMRRGTSGGHAGGFDIGAAVAALCHDMQRHGRIEGTAAAATYPPVHPGQWSALRGAGATHRAVGVLRRRPERFHRSRQHPVLLQLSVEQVGAVVCARVGTLPCAHLPPVRPGAPGDPGGAPPARGERRHRPAHRAAAAAGLPPACLSPTGDRVSRGRACADARRRVRFLRHTLHRRPTGVLCGGRRGCRGGATTGGKVFRTGAGSSPSIDDSNFGGSGALAVGAATDRTAVLLPATPVAASVRGRVSHPGVVAPGHSGAVHPHRDDERRAAVAAVSEPGGERHGGGRVARARLSRRQVSRPGRPGAAGDVDIRGGAGTRASQDPAGVDAHLHQQCRHGAAAGAVHRPGG